MFYLPHSAQRGCVNARQSQPNTPLCLPLPAAERLMSEFLQTGFAGGRNEHPQAHPGSKSDGGIVLQRLIGCVMCHS